MYNQLFRQHQPPYLAIISIPMTVAKISLMVTVPLCRTAQNAHGLILLMIQTLGVQPMLSADAQIRILRPTQLLLQSIYILMVIAALSLMVTAPLYKTAQNAPGLILLVIQTLGIPPMLIADATLKEIQIQRPQVSSLP